MNVCFSILILAVVNDILVAMHLVVALVETHFLGVADYKTLITTIFCDALSKVNYPTTNFNYNLSI